MKTFLLASAALACLSLAASAQAPVTPGAVKLGKVAPAMVKTPECALSSGPVKRTGRAQEWFEIEVEYETKPEEIDELTFKFTAQIAKQLVTGEVTYQNIAAARDHFAVIYISPKGLEKLLGKTPLGPNSIENVWVEVNHQGQTLGKEGEAAFKPQAKPNAQQKPGFMLTKSQTPFAPLWYDRYEEIKASK